MLANLSIWCSLCFAQAKERCSLWKEEAPWFVWPALSDGHIPRTFCVFLHHPWVPFRPWPYVDKIWCWLSLWRLPFADRSPVATFGTRWCLSFSWSPPDTSSDTVSWWPHLCFPECRELASPRTLGWYASPCSFHEPDLTRGSFWSQQWQSSCHQHCLVTGTPVEEWGRSAHFLTKPHVALWIPRIVWGKAILVPGVKVTARERADLRSGWVCKNRKESRLYPILWWRSGCKNQCSVLIICLVFSLTFGY